jgi:hypothetical protein
MSTFREKRNEANDTFHTDTFYCCPSPPKTKNSPKKPDPFTHTGKRAESGKNKEIRRTNR